MSRLRVLLADEDEEQLRSLERVVRDLGHEVAAHAVTVAEAGNTIACEEPDISIVALHEDREHALALISQLTEYAAGPVVAALTGDDDPEFVKRAAEEGIFACAQGVSREAVQTALEVALERHREAAGLEERVDRLESALERRAVIERAKGMLMERHGIDDRAAFERLRSHARSNNRKVVDVAGAVVEGHITAPGA